MKIIISKSALPPSLYRKFVKGWDKQRYADLFQKYASDRNAYRIYLPINSMTKLTHIVVPKDIEDAVSSKGYIVDDYINGIAVDSSGKRRIKIGKILPPELQQKFANDKSRQGARNAAQGGLCVISRHPYDVAGMSTDRGWTSCMNLIGGINKHFVPEEVKEGSIIAYLVGKDDKNISKPSARILMRVYESETGKKGLFPSAIYGTGSFEFSSTVSKWCAEVNRDYFGIPYGTSMKLLANLYEDDGLNVRVVKKHDPEADAKDVAKSIQKNASHMSAYDIAEFVTAYAESQLPLVIQNLPRSASINALEALSSFAYNSDLDIRHSAAIYKQAIDYFKTKKGTAPKYQVSRVNIDVKVAAASYLAFPESPITKDDLEFVCGLIGSDIQYAFMNIFENDRYLNPYVFTQYAEAGFDAQSFATFLFEEANADWAIFPLPEELSKPLQKLAKAEGDNLSPSLYGVLKPEDLRKAYKNMYDGYVRDSKFRGRSFGHIYNISKEATDAYILKTDPTKFKMLWRGDSILPAMVLPISQAVGSPNFYEYSKQVGAAFNKFLAADAKRDWAWTTQVVSVAVLDTFCKVCTKQFLQAIDPKYYSTTLFQAFAHDLSMSDDLNRAAYVETAAFIKATPELFALFAPTNLGLTDELEKRVLQSLFKNQAFGIQCMRNSAALEKAKPTMPQAKVVGFWPVIEAIAVNETDEDVVQKLKDLGLTPEYLPMIRNLERLML